MTCRDSDVDWRKIEVGSVVTDGMRMVFGTTHVGDVDQTDDLKITTLFVHCCGIPIVPMRSILLLDGKQLERVPLSLKSVFAAWLRAFLVVVGGFFLLGGTIRLLKGALPDALIWGVIGGFFVLLYRVTKRLFRAGKRRAEELRARKASTVPSYLATVNG